MIRALLLILDPIASWEKILKAQRGVPFILLTHLLPLMVLTLGLETFALTRLGEQRGLFGAYTKIPVELAVRYGAAEMILNLLVVVLGAKLVQKIANNFRGEHTYRQCFTVLAYGLSPIFLGHFLDAAPFLNTWVCFGIGLVLSLAAMYQGVPLILRPDHAKALGLYFTVVVLVGVLATVAHLLSWLLLREDIDPAQWDRLRHSFGF